jgi:hypothetical protein
MQAKHSLDKLFEALLMDLLKEKPADPLQFIIDSLSMGPEHAAQASAFGPCSTTGSVVELLLTSIMPTVTVCQALAGMQGCEIQATQQLLRWRIAMLLHACPLQARNQS